MPWGDITIEPVFGEPDSGMAQLALELSKLDSVSTDASLPFRDRFVAQSISQEQRELLGLALASLISRSPGFRNKLDSSTLTYRAEMGFGNYKDEIDRRNLIVANMNSQYDYLRKIYKSRGKILLLFSDNTEFIFGEGFLHAGIHGVPKCFVPLLPGMAIALYQPHISVSRSNITTIRLSDEEVKTCNFITQVYSKDYIYYREVCPDIVWQFKCNEYREFRYQSHPWLDLILEELARF